MRKRPPKSAQQGVAIVEFALILPLLLLLSFTTTEFGRALYEYETVAKSVRQAARYLTMQNEGSHTTEGQNLVVYGYTTPPAGARPLARGLTLANVPTPTWQNAGSGPIIRTVTVTVTNYQFRSIFTTAFGVNFGTITFADITATMRSHM
jgi:Flp pilus assembly protein TadG